jgi:hypothetical protein
MEAFSWSKASDRAAQLIAEGDLTLAQIGESVGRDQRTLWNWRQHPEFVARIDEHLAIFRDEVRRRGIAVRERRINALNDRWLRLHSVIEQRAADPAMAAVPGGATGLLVHDVKGIGSGESARVVDLYEVDVGLLRELREHERQAAQELGQWTEKQEISGDAEKPVVVKMIRGVSMSDL